MGKWKQGSEAKQNGWGYWHGSWSAWKPAAEAASPKGIAAYDAQKPRQEGPSAAHQPPEPAQDSEAGLVQGLQRAAKTARKAEGRVKRIQAEKAEKQLQWKSWEQELRRTFAKERARFVEAIAKLDGEMMDALQQQSDARAKLRSVAAGEFGRKEEEPVDLASAEFDALMAGSPNPWDGDMAQDAILKRALEETMATTRATSTAQGQQRGAMTTPPRSTLAPPMTPHRVVEMPAQAQHVPQQARSSHGTRLLPFPPPAGRPQADVVSPGHLVATADPYTGLLTGAGEPIAGLGASGRLQSPAGGPPKTPKVRLGVKDSARPTKPVHPAKFPGFQEKIAQKRGSLTAELRRSGSSFTTTRTQAKDNHQD